MTVATNGEERCEEEGEEGNARLGVTSASPSDDLGSRLGLV